MRESTIQARIRLAIAKYATVFRNNSGVAKYPDGSTVRYGVANPGGSDLIGWRSIVVTPDMVGKKLAIFTAIECKSKNGVVSGEQQTFLNAVRKAGGYSGVARSEQDALDICIGRCEYNNVE